MFGGKKPDGTVANGAASKPNGATTGPSIQAAAPIAPAPVAPASSAITPQPAAAKPSPKQMTPEMMRDPAIQKQVADVRTKLQAAVGQIVLAMSSLPRYRNQLMGDVQSLVLDPLMRDRIAIASEKTETADAAQTLAGIAFWATVSPEVDARIREQIKTGSFPVRLKSSDWASGEIVWLLDVIAPSQKLATDVLLSFSKVQKVGSDVRIHPVVARQIDPELMKKLTASGAAAPAKG